MHEGLGKFIKPEQEEYRNLEHNMRCEIPFLNAAHWRQQRNLQSPL